MTTVKFSLLVIFFTSQLLASTSDKSIEAASMLLQKIVDSIPATAHVRGLGYSNMAGSTGPFKQVTMGVVRSEFGNKEDPHYQECSIRFEGDRLTLVARLAEDTNALGQSLASDFTSGDGFDLFPAMIPSKNISDYGDSGGDNSWIEYKNTGLNLRLKTVENVRIELSGSNIRSVTMKVRTLIFLSEKEIRCDLGQGPNQFGYE